MTNQELQKLMEELAVKINTLAALQLTIATTVNEGCVPLLASSNVLLEVSRHAHGQIDRLERGE